MARRSSEPQKDAGASDSLRRLLDAEDQLASRLAARRLEAQRIVEDARAQARLIEAAAGEQRRARIEAITAARERALQAEVERIRSEALARADHFDSVERSLVEELAAFLVAQVVPGDDRRRGERP
jgi:vacuolar-type H+-ATPase subunit H